jgi:hypothetical protein
VVHSEQLQREVSLDAESLSSFLEGEDIKPYIIRPPRMAVIIPYRSDTTKTEIIPPSTFKRECPKTWAYLCANKKELEAREDGRMESENWYGYIYPKNLGLIREVGVWRGLLVRQAHYEQEHFDRDLWGG